MDRNAAIFPVDDPAMTPLTGDSTIVVVNDARHQLEGNFLQRTVPYFFELTGGHPTVASGGRYRWAKVRLLFIVATFLAAVPCRLAPLF